MTMRSGHSRVAWPVVAGALAVLLLAGCAAQSGAGDAGSAAPSATGPPVPPSSSARPVAPSTTTAASRPSVSTAPARPPSSVRGVDVVVRGTVRDGVEAGCLLLDGQDKQAYLLLDADPAKLRVGTRVEVVGQRVDQLVSYCGEGVALSVVSVRPLR
jgi:hypothetical protein